MDSPALHKTPNKETANTSPESGDLAGLAWKRIRADIIAGKLAPGARLRISLMRSSYGIGASPLREALSRLVSERLVVSLDRRGFAVAPISLKELRDLTDLRKLLENEALRQSLARGDEAWEARVVSATYRLGKLHARIQRGDLSGIHEWETLNQEFHEALVSACDSLFLLDLRREVYVYQKRYRQLFLSLTSPARDVHEEHSAMQDAAIARNFERLRELSDGHLEGVYESIVAAASWLLTA